MKNIVLKISVVLCATVLICGLLCSGVSNATSPKNAINIIGKGGNGNADAAMGAATLMLGSVLNVIRIVGAAIAIAILLIIATKYIIASAGDRADIKKYAVNYVIGALIFLGASGILTIIRAYVMSATATK